MAGELTIPGLLLELASSRPDELCLVHRDRRLTFSGLADRSHRFANVLTAAKLTLHRERAELTNWESGQDHVALLLRNGTEYLECMFGAFTARAVTFNVNFRYTADELAEVFADARPRALVVHSEFAAIARQAIERVGGVDLVLQVDDGTGGELLPGARWYETELGMADTAPPRSDWSPDDLYMLFTGGTTGRPKGVLWRQGDAVVSTFSVLDRDGREFETPGAVVEAAAARRRRRVVLPTPPFIHGASQWMALGALVTGAEVVVQEDVGRLDPDDIFDTVERHGATELMLVGDAFGRPLAEALERRPRDLPTLRAFVNGGAALSAGVRDRLLAALPDARVVDNMGSSESGRQATRQFTTGSGHEEMRPLDGTVVVSEDRRRILELGDAEIGWLARSGRVPLGYLNDQPKTAATFPVISGTRYAVPGDRARLLGDGTVDVLGRDSTVINTGGEKVFGEEVEDVLLTHPAVDDALVIGRPNPLWGEEVVALVAARQPISEAQLLEHAEGHLARYKLPKRTIFVDAVPRTVAGKPDHRAAHARCEVEESKVDAREPA